MLDLVLSLNSRSVTCTHTFIHFVGLLVQTMSFLLIKKGAALFKAKIIEVKSQNMFKAKLSSLGDGVEILGSVTLMET